MKCLAELSPGNWVDTRQPLRVVTFVSRHIFMIGDLTTRESPSEIAAEHPGPYHVIEVRAWMGGYAETPLREVYYDREIARARELQIVDALNGAMLANLPGALPTGVHVLLAQYFDGSAPLGETALCAFVTRAAAEDTADLIERASPSKNTAIVEVKLR